MRICFLAPSGFGKTTAVEILKGHYDITNIKIGEPIYELQTEFYKKIGEDIGKRQDGELLQFYGKKIRKENKDYLLDVFKEKLDKSHKSIIINDDCRPDDYEFLKKENFIFIKINGYKRDRNDKCEINSKDKVEWQSNIPYDYEIDNYNGIEEYEKKLIDLINKLSSPKCYIIPTQKTCNCNCIFCISNTRKYDKEKEYLEVNENFIKNIYNLKKHGIKRFEITGGGEPMLNNNLSLISQTIKKIIPDSYIKLYTNGNILKRINNIDEINISIVSDNLNINNKFMNGNNIELIDKLKFFKDKNIKLRLSIPLIKGSIDTKEKLDYLINKSENYVDEYVVRTLYPGTKYRNNLYIDFDYNRDKVIVEKDNDVKQFKDIILWSDNKFYNSWNLNNYKYLNSYLLLKPDSKTYINEIENIIKDQEFEIIKRYLLKDFKTIVKELYKEKDNEYLKKIERHLNNLSYLFGDNGLVYMLDKNKTLEELYFDTLKLKNIIRNTYGFTDSLGGYISKDNKISYVNLVHCPNVDSNIYDRDLNYINNINLEEISEDKLIKIKKYRSYDVWF